jgi:uncharacterized protein
MIKRAKYIDLKEHLASKEISLITGPRQAGKTTLMRLLDDELKKANEKTLFLNLDIEADKVHFNSQSSLLDKIELEIGKEKGFVFIDEIQRKENAGLFLKGLYDMDLSYKFIVSGSGSLELKEKIHESLAGRKRIIELSTITFEEFVNYKTEYRYDSKLGNFFRIEKERTAEFLEQYLNMGGYPKVMLEDLIDEKRKLIDEIFQSYIEKDIRYLFEIKKTEAFTDLFKIVSSQSGSLTNISEISSTLDISAATVREYLWYLEKTFIIKKVTPFHKNIRKEITKSPLYYFYDLGLKNYAIGEYGSVSQNQRGHLFENFVYNALSAKTEYSSASINFWRTKDGAEVDFVFSIGDIIVPIEVKYKKYKKPEITRSLHSFISAYKPKTAHIINLDFKAEVQAGSTKVYFTPFYEMFDEKFLT